MNLLGPELETLAGDERELLRLLLEKEGSSLRALLLNKRTDREWAPMSSTQRRLWAAQKVHRGKAFGNVDLAFRVSGLFQLDAAQAALDCVIERHEILRTTYEEHGGVWMQHIHPACPSRIEFIDLRAIAPESAWETAIRTATVIARRPFDLTNQLPIRSACIRVQDDEALFLFVVHHLAMDGWGMRLFLQEFSECYAAFAAGREIALPNLAVQYGDFAAWEERDRGDTTGEERFEYWRQQLAGVESLKLPILRRGDSRAFRSRVKMVSLGRELSDRFRAFSRERGVTLFTACTAFLGVWFYRHSRQADLAIGTILSNRNRPETERLIGNFGNRVFLKLRIREGMSFLELLAQAREVVLGAHAHAEFPLENLEPGMTLPDFNFLFVMRDSVLAENLKLPELEIRHVPLEIEAPLVDLKVDLAEGDETICGAIEYKEPEFTDEWMSTLWCEFVRWIEVAMANPRMSIAATAPGLGRTMFSGVEVEGR